MTVQSSMLELTQNPSNIELLDSEVDEHSETERRDADEPERWSAGTDLDAESLFSAEVAGEALLTRPEEEALARRIVRARKRVRAILRRARRLARTALADAGRGVVLPERDFREREAIAILRFAENALRTPAGTRAIGMDRRGLKSFITELRAALAAYRIERDRMVRANVRLVALLA